MKRVLTITVFFLMVSSMALAAGNQIPADWTEATPEALAEAGLELLLKGDYPAMADTWFKSANPALLDKKKMALAKRQFAAQLPVYEKFLRYELVEKRIYGKSLARLTYLVVCEKVPMVFRFFYYKPENEWQFQSVNFNDEKRDLPE